MLWDYSEIHGSLLGSTDHETMYRLIPPLIGPELKTYNMEVKTSKSDVR
jgi:hypothetical protein